MDFNGLPTAGDMNHPQDPFNIGQKLWASGKTWSGPKNHTTVGD